MVLVKSKVAKRILSKRAVPKPALDFDQESIDLDALEASVCRDSFFEFVKVFWRFTTAEPLVMNWHIRYLCDQLQECATRVFKGQIKLHDLVVNISPGTSKSTVMSVLFPAWVWTVMPNAQVICASYSEKLAMDLSLKCRDVIESELYRRYFPQIKLRDDQNTKSFFKNSRGGYRYSVGVNGTVTGMHGHFIVIDDPLNPEEAMSELELTAANRWIRQTLSSRKVDKGVTVTILVMQRLHQDDPTAQFLEKKKVKHVCLPAEDAPTVKPVALRRYYRTDPLHPKRAKVMDARRLGHDVLDEAKENGQYYYAGQFMQTPVPPGGGMFLVNRVKAGLPMDWYHKDKVYLARNWQRLVRYWDKAGTDGGGAFTVGTLMGLDVEGRFWVLDVKRFRLDSYDRERRIAETALDDGEWVEVGVEQEPGSGGKGSAEDTVRRLGAMGNFVVRVQVVNKSTGDKVRRAEPFGVQVNAGNVYVPKGAEWIATWLDELNIRFRTNPVWAAFQFSPAHTQPDWSIPVNRVWGAFLPTRRFSPDRT
jgi:predicted phage terminase large subunit-like protein